MTFVDKFSREVISVLTGQCLQEFVQVFSQVNIRHLNLNLSLYNIRKIKNSRTCFWTKMDHLNPNRLDLDLWKEISRQ